MVFRRDDLFDELVNQGKLTRGLDDMLTKLTGAFGLDAFEQIWMVTNLSELHQYVVVVFHRDRFFRAFHIVDDTGVATNLSEKVTVKIDLSL